jgi:hypothetical protein
MLHLRLILHSHAHNPLQLRYGSRRHNAGLKTYQSVVNSQRTPHPYYFWLVLRMHTEPDLGLKHLGQLTSCKTQLTLDQLHHIQLITTMTDTAAQLQLPD